MIKKWSRTSNIPAWVLAQYSEYLQEIYTRDWNEHDDTKVTNAERIQFYDRIVHNLEGIEFWSAMNKRYKKLEAFWRIDLDADVNINHVENLLEMAFSLSRWTSTLEKTTPSKRKTIGRRLHNQSSRLIEEINVLRSQIECEFKPPNELAFALSDEAMQALNSIKKSGELWEKSRPVVQRPNVDGPEARYFILGVAEYFEHFYGKDLYSATASLTRCVYADGTVSSPI